MIFLLYLQELTLGDSDELELELVKLGSIYLLMAKTLKQIHSTVHQCLAKSDQDLF